MNRVADASERWSILSSVFDGSSGQFCRIVSVSVTKPHPLFLRSFLLGTSE